MTGMVNKTPGKIRIKSLWSFSPCNRSLPDLALALARRLIPKK